jgi:hypothetical protein
VTVPSGRGRGTATALGDMQLFDLAVIPWPGRDSGLLMGVGPVFVFPTATDKAAGEGAWQIGPAFGAIYKGIPGILLGGARPEPHVVRLHVQRPPGSQYDDRVQPIVLVHLWRGLYVKSADASWTIGWHEGAARTFPLSLGLGWVILRDDAPPLNLFVSGEWLVYRENAPVAPQTTVRFGLTVAFPSGGRGPDRPSPRRWRARAQSDGISPSFRISAATASVISSIVRRTSRGFMLSVVPAHSSLRSGTEYTRVSTSTSSSCRT